MGLLVTCNPEEREVVLGAEQKSLHIPSKAVHVHAHEKSFKTVDEEVSSSSQVTDFRMRSGLSQGLGLSRVLESDSIC